MMETLADNPSESSSSQNAWAEEEGDGGITSLGDARLDSPESYDGNGSESTARNETPLSTGSSATSSSRLRKLLKKIWRTAMTEDTSHNRELHIKLTLRELIIYLVFLVDLCIITFGMINSNMFYFTNVMQHVFVRTPFGPSAITFENIGCVDDYWNYIRGPLLAGLYDNQWYNGDNFTSAEQGYIYYENKLLGVPRLRSLRVRNDSCIVPGDFQDDIPFCYNEYSAASEDQTTFGPANGTAWTYQTASQLQGSSYTGLVTSYGGGGYVQDFGMTHDTSARLINDLMTHRWIDRGTRVAFVDFTVYNANVNLFCVMRLIVEFPATGGALASVLFQTVKLIRYVSPFDYFVLVCEIIFILFFVYYIVEETIEIARNRLAYFKSFWNIVDLVVVATAACVIAFNIHRTVIVDSLLSTLLQRPDVFADFSSLSYWQYVFNVLIAVLVFVAWLKLFKFIAFNRTMTHLSSTLSRAAKDVAAYALMFFIVFFAFAQLGYLLFGAHLHDFCSFGDSVFTLFRIVLGDFDFIALQTAHRVLGPLFFVLYVFFIYFVLINMFLAIISDTYTDVKDELAEQKGNMEITDYLKQKYNRLIKRLTERKQKKQESQSAKTSTRAGTVADANNMVDVGEWKRGLKSQGYTEVELDAACASCDVDGSHMIDKKELAKLSRELSRKQQVALDDSDDDDSDEDERSARSKSTRSGGGGRHGNSGVGGVSNEEFSVLTRRVDRMEHSIGSIVSKIDAVLVKLEALERTKAKRRETTIRALGSITEAEGRVDESRRADMERHVLDELERWDSESSLGMASARGLSPGGADRHASAGGARSRPVSMHIDSNV